MNNNNYNKCSNCKNLISHIHEVVYPSDETILNAYLFGFMAIIKTKCYYCNHLLYYTRYLLHNNQYFYEYCLIDNKYIDKQFSLLIDVISKYCVYNDKQDLLNEYNKLPEYFKMQELLLMIKLIL